MSRLKVNSIVNTANDGGIELEKGLIVDSGALTLESQINVTGVITATAFSGSGTNLTNVGSATTAQVLALNLILGYDAYRA